MTKDDAFQRLVEWRWPDGEPKCPHCGTDAPYFVTTRYRFNCRSPKCRRCFSPTSGTELHQFKLGIERLAEAIDEIAARPHDTVAEISRDLGMSYKGCDYLVKRLRADSSGIAFSGAGDWF